MRATLCSWLFCALMVPGLALADKSTEVASFDEALAAIKSNVERHNWLGVIEWADDEHRTTQLGMGMTHAQYVAELLSLNWENNSINSDPNTAITEADLNRIRKVNWRTNKHESNGWTTVTGTVRLRNFKTLIIEVNLVKTSEGWRLTGAVG